MEKGIHIEPANIEMMLYGMDQVCRSVKKLACEYTVDGILTRIEDLSKEENAFAYISDYTDLIHGTFEMLSAGLGIITDGLANNEIEITAK